MRDLVGDHSLGHAKFKSYKTPHHIIFVLRSIEDEELGVVELLR
jgi:hypothetical protein